MSTATTSPASDPACVDSPSAHVARGARMTAGRLERLNLAGNPIAAVRAGELALPSLKQVRA